MEMQSGLHAVMRSAGIGGIFPIVDTIDKHGECRNGEAAIMNPCRTSVAKMVEDIKKHYAAKGYTVTAILELLHGHTEADIKRMSREEAEKHCRFLYLDPKALKV